MEWIKGNWYWVLGGFAALGRSAKCDVHYVYVLLAFTHTHAHTHTHSHPNNTAANNVQKEKAERPTAAAAAVAAAACVEKAEKAEKHTPDVRLLPNHHR